jgi:tRNA-2-methylthio-N6-dimethylallyladenosine synthase
MKFYVETFGCQMNVADSQEMGRRLAARGLAPTETAADADVILVNTCTVRDHAEHKALSYLGRLTPWKSQDPSRCVILAGCAAERLQGTIRRRFPHVSVVVGAKSIDRFDELIDAALPALAFDGDGETLDAWGWMKGAAETPSSVTAHVTLMRGCNFSCSYCVVPQVRGREKYRPAASLLAEVREKAARGQPEILLLGQTVNSYRPAGPNPGPDGREVRDFADLLRAVAAEPGVRRIRFMSPHPHHVDDRFIAAVAETPAVCPHVHLPAQSGSDRLLPLMRRNYSRRDYVEKAARLRRAVPGLSLTTDLIVGFPGETEADFAETLSLVREVDFEGAYTFKYSPRPGTSSATLPDDVSTEVKEERLARLREWTDRLAEQKTAAQVGARTEALIEARRGKALEARTPHGRKIFLEGADAPAGALVPCRVDRADGKTLYGSPCP